MRVRSKGLVLVFLILAFATGQAFPASAEFTEVTRLAALCKVWGFLKYYHPKVAQGDIDWDAQLSQAIVRAKGAGSREELGAVFNRLIKAAGDIDSSNAPSSSPSASRNEPILGWLRDATHFAEPTVSKLELLIGGSHVKTNRFYRPVRGVGNMDFSGDAADPSTGPYPDQNDRLLALFRYWNIIQYFHPHKRLIGADWEAVLAEFIPRFRDAGSALEYHLGVSELAARLHDGHAATVSAVLSKYWGRYYPPFFVRFVEGRTVVTMIKDDVPAPGAGTLMAGDIILRADGIPVEALRGELAKYIGASNGTALQRNLDLCILRGAEPTLRLTVLRGGQELEIDVARYLPSGRPTALPGWKILPGNIGYVNTGALEVARVAAMMRQLSGTKAIIFDVRIYPQFSLHEITKRLNPEARPFAKFSLPDPDAPGFFLRTPAVPTGPASPNPDYYRGKVVILVDETTLSRGEFTAMALQTAPDNVVIGSRTAGADGNVSWVSLPGGITTYFTGLGVYYPDGRETQGIGIVPDIEVKPTLEGIRSGRDEPLERALEYINGGEAKPAARDRHRF